MPSRGSGNKTKYISLASNGYSVLADHSTEFQTWKVIVPSEHIAQWMSEGFVKNIDYCDNRDGSYLITERVLLMLTLRWA